MVEQEALRQNVPVNLALAIAWVESSMNQNAINHSDPGKAWGVMQILPSTARWMGYRGKTEDLLKPENSIKYGIKYLAYQLKRYRGNVVKAAAAYNAGSVRYGRRGFINQRYVDKVMGVGLRRGWKIN